jgi:hypothetical protein
MDVGDLNMPLGNGGLPQRVSGGIDLATLPSL